MAESGGRSLGDSLDDRALLPGARRQDQPGGYARGDQHGAQETISQSGVCPEAEGVSGTDGMESGLSLTESLLVRGGSLQHGRGNEESHGDFHVEEVALAAPSQGSRHADDPRCSLEEEPSLAGYASGEGDCDPLRPLRSHETEAELCGSTDLHVSSEEQLKMQMVLGQEEEAEGMDSDAAEYRRPQRPRS